MPENPWDNLIHWFSFLADQTNYPRLTIRIFKGRSQEYLLIFKSPNAPEIIQIDEKIEGLNDLLKIVCLVNRTAKAILEPRSQIFRLESILESHPSITI